MIFQFIFSKNIYVYLNKKLKEVRRVVEEAKALKMKELEVKKLKF